jgi:uncharacterized membrane protein YdjX (TVP38/TMEM64 family)
MTSQKATGLAAQLPFLMIVLAAAIGAFALRDHLTFDALAQNRDKLIAFRDQNYPLAVLAFMLAYTAIVALSLPGATLATLTGGFLFGIFPGVLFNITAATIGATLIFLAAKHGFGARFAERLAERGGAATRLQAALINNEWSALLIMRLAPVVPFFMANLIPAFVGARTSRFIITTFFGIMPGGLILTSIGAGLDSVFAKGEMPDLSILFAPRILLPILGLVALSALPIVIKALRKKAR